MDKTVIEYIASLSRIELDNQEKEIFIHQLNNILLYIEKLDKLNTSNVKPMVHTTDMSNVFRDDIEAVSISRKEALFNAPSKMGSFIKVPKVIG